VPPEEQVEFGAAGCDAGGAETGICDRAIEAHVAREKARTAMHLSGTGI
jgi:hypothetical protein